MITLADLVADGFQYFPKSGWWKRNGKRVGAVDSKGYVRVTVRGRKYPAHRLAVLWVTGEWPKAEEEVDHRDLRRSNNRWKNLRVVTHQQNAFNFGPRSKTGIRGVTWDKRREKYRVQVMRDGKSMSIGHFDCVELAQLVAEEARGKIYV